MPGDELLAAADGVSTRAITINAPPSNVWPWIVQIGPSPRGGVYTYDWIENLLGLNMHSTNEVLEEFQHPELGDAIGFGANKMEICSARSAALDGLALDRRQLGLVLQPDRGQPAARASSVAIVSGCRGWPTRSGWSPMVPGSLVMERKMLLGIKQRAESLKG